MPVLSNLKHERFALELAKGRSQAEAYVAAGYAPSEPNASRLTRHDKVRERVAELQSRVADRVEVTLASLLRHAEEARALAIQLGQPSAAVAAIKEMGVLAGVRVEKRETAHRNLDAMTDDDLLAIARGEPAAQTTSGPRLSH